MLRHQDEVFGPVASAATCWRALDEIGPAQLRRIGTARAKVRAWVWALMGQVPAAGAAGRDIGEGVSDGLWCATRRWCAVRRWKPKEVQDLLAWSSQRLGRSWAQPDPGDAGEGGKRRRQRRDGLVLPDGSGPASEDQTVYERHQCLKLRKRGTDSNLVDVGRDAVRDVRCLLSEVNFVAGLACRWGGHEEGLRRTRGEAAGAKLDTKLIDRFLVNTGTVLYRSGPLVIHTGWSG